MLKLTYTDADVYIECLSMPIETAIAQRVTLAMRCGEMLHVMPNSASFLLSAHLPQLAQLQQLLKPQSEAIALAPADADWVEITLYGSWLSCSPQAHEGIFLTALPAAIERLVYQLWQASVCIQSV
ncbi:MAG: alr0857 family protein, partial [Cyanobacteriota bacterium]